MHHSWRRSALPIVLTITTALCAAFLSASARADEEESMWLWQDGERYTTQCGSAGADLKRAAVRGVCLGMNWGAAADH